MKIQSFLFYRDIPMLDGTLVNKCFSDPDADVYHLDFDSLPQMAKYFHDLLSFYSAKQMIVWIDSVRYMYVNHSCCLFHYIYNFNSYESDKN